jgi:hypothetical protein
LIFSHLLSDYSGEATIFGAESGATVVPRTAEVKRIPPVGTVRVTRGDDLRRAAGLPVPKAIKIEVEGAEFGALSGLKDTLASRVCELLCLEIHPHLAPAEVSTEMVLSLVRSLGSKQAGTNRRGNAIHLIAGKVPA